MYKSRIAALVAFSLLIALFAMLLDGHKSKDDHPDKWTAKYILKDGTLGSSIICGFILLCYCIYAYINWNSENVIESVSIGIGLAAITVLLILLNVGSSKNDKGLGGYTKVMIDTGLGMSCVGWAITVFILAHPSGQYFYGRGKYIYRAGIAPG